MKRYLPGALLLVAAVFLSSTGFQCGSAEATSAKLYMSQKQWQKAEESLLKQLAKNDKDEESWFLLGQVRLEVKNYAGMNDAYSHALALSDAHKSEIGRNRLGIWAILYNEGVSYYNRGRDTASYFDKALGDFSTAITLQPDSSSTYYVTALTHFAMHHVDDARQSLESALKKKPNYVEAARFLGQVYYTLAQARLDAKDTTGAQVAYTKAVDAFKTAYDLQPDEAENITNLIDAYERTKQIDKAAALTSEAVKRDPGNKLYHYAHGVFLLKTEKYPEGVEEFKKALEIDPNYSDARYNLGVAYLNWGVSLRAEATKAPEAKGSKAAKQEDTSYKEKFKQALPYLEQSVQLRGDDIGLWTQLGRLYAILNMQDKSKEAFDKAANLSKPK